MSFIRDLGYLRGVIPQDEADWKCMKRLINTRLLVEVGSQEDRKIMFGMI